MDMKEALQIFFEEAHELLSEMEAALLRLTEHTGDAECINAVFRAAHTIKGSAGLFGLDDIVAFTHRVEGVLDRVRAGETLLDDALISTLLKCGDHIARLINGVETGAPELDENGSRAGAELSAKLSCYFDGAAAIADDRAAEATSSESADGSRSSNDPSRDADAATAVPAHWRIRVRFGQDVFRNGMDPLSFIRYLGTFGEIERVMTIADQLPTLDAIDAETCYLAFDIFFATEADRTAIEGAFEFVADDCVLDIARIDEHCDVPTIAPGAPTASAAPPSPVSTQTGQNPTVKTAVGPAPSERQSVRVDADKIDRLIDLVGELITAAASASVLAKRAQNAQLQESTATLSALVEGVRDSALQLRMVKIGGTFSRFHRVVHDVARELGKDIELRVSGEDTELDKTVVERIGDPLMHLVRNAMDHGIEARETRVARSKPAHGTLSLNAYHDSGSIVIEVSDDGGGLDRERILAKAVSRGLVDADRAMTDAEVHALIFEPGFSTADQVTKLSGRGVGMDVVKRNIS